MCSGKALLPTLGAEQWVLIMAACWYCLGTLAVMMPDYPCQGFWFIGLGCGLVVEIFVSSTGDGAVSH